MNWYWWYLVKLVLTYSANMHQFAEFVIKIACLKFCIASTNLANVKNNDLIRDCENTSWFCRTVSMIYLKVPFEITKNTKYLVHDALCDVEHFCIWYVCCLIMLATIYFAFIFKQIRIFLLWRYSSWYWCFFRSRMNHGFHLISAVFFFVIYQYYICKQVSKCFKSYESFCH